MAKPVVYVIGSLRNPNAADVCNKLRKEFGDSLEVFDSWYAASENADDAWRDYEKAKGLSYIEALNDHAAKHIFEFDKKHIDRADFGLLVMPCGKSGHLELGYLIGRGKPTIYYIPEDAPERWDVMVQFAKYRTFSFADVVGALKFEIGKLRGAPAWSVPYNTDVLYRTGVEIPADTERVTLNADDVSGRINQK